MFWPYTVEFAGSRKDVYQRMEGEPGQGTGVISWKERMDLQHIFCHNVDMTELSIQIQGLNNFNDFEKAFFLESMELQKLILNSENFRLR